MALGNCPKTIADRLHRIQSIKIFYAVNIDCDFQMLIQFHSKPLRKCIKMFDDESSEIFLEFLLKRIFVPNITIRQRYGANHLHISLSGGITFVKDAT